MPAPFTSFVGECGHIKDTRAKKTKKRAWHGDEVHQIPFDNVRATITRDVVLAYPDFLQEFDIYTDVSSKQLGAVITHGNKPKAFFSRKLTGMQQCYSVAKIELLTIVETLKESKACCGDKGLPQTESFSGGYSLRNFVPKSFTSKAPTIQLPMPSLD
ncbi:hypothetical protein ACHAW6_009011 [Cyclotella cf. meneghiniana]